MGTGYGAAQAADGVADVNGNYWQTVQGKDKGAWWQQDLGKVLVVRGVKVSWARLENRVHCPPASMVIQVSLTGADGSWRDVRRISTQEESLVPDSPTRQSTSGVMRAPNEPKPALCGCSSQGRPARGKVPRLPFPSAKWKYNRPACRRGS